MVQFDPFGLPLSTKSAASAASFNAGLTRLLQQQAGAGEEFRRALEHDPEYGLASLALGVALRAEANMKAGSEAIASAAQLRLDERTASLLAGIVMQTQLQFDDADAAFEQHLRKWPTDALALSLRLAILNVFSSRPDRDAEMLRSVRNVIPFFGEDPYPLSALAFALARTRRSTGRSRESVRQRPSSNRARRNR